MGYGWSNRQVAGSIPALGSSHTYVSGRSQPNGSNFGACLKRSFSVTLKAMEVQLTPDQKAFVRQAIQSGRLHREEDAVQEALALWEERERTRAEILVAVDEAEASLARGEGRVITQQSMRDLAGEVKQRGRDRLASEQPPVR
jgi:Arc/MetJ-type ribon-helix-helix transcriptional regulator